MSMKKFSIILEIIFSGIINKCNFSQSDANGRDKIDKVVSLSGFHVV